MWSYVEDPRHQNILTQKDLHQLVDILSRSYMEDYYQQSNSSATQEVSAPIWSHMEDSQQQNIQLQKDLQLLIDSFSESYVKYVLQEKQLSIDRFSKSDIEDSYQQSNLIQKAPLLLSNSHLRSQYTENPNQWSYRITLTTTLTLRLLYYCQTVVQGVNA